MKLFFKLLSVGFFFGIITLHAQAPPGINYQGVARNLEGKPLVSQDVRVRVSILKESENGDAEYVETHAIKTNAFGLFTLVIGKGQVRTGNFAFISWAVGNKWLAIELDPTGGNSYQLMGSQQLMSVPYAFYSTYSGNGLVAGEGISISNQVIKNTGDADNNPANELIQSVTFGTDKKLRITDAGGTKEADLNSLVGAGQNLEQVLAMGNNGGGKALTNIANPTGLQDAATKSYVDAHSDADADPSNEIQDLSITNNQLSITNKTNATPINLTPYLDNTDTQTLSLAGSSLSISGGNSVDLSPLMDATPDLSLASTGTQRTIGITGGTGVLLDVADNDNNSTNELQDLALQSNLLSITNNSSATSIDLSGYLDNTDQQDLSLSGTTLILSNDATTVNLSGFLDNTDAQTLSTQSVNANTRSVSISGGNTVDVDVRDADASTTNEIQDLSLAANTLSLSNDATTVDLSAYLDNTDAQTLSTASVNANTRSVTISGGNSVNVDVRDADASTTNEIQSLSLSGNTLSLTNDAATVSLATYLDNTDNQDLTLSTNILSLSNDATTVDLSAFLDNTDAQILSTASVNANTRSVTISGGNSVNVDVRDADFSTTNEIQNLSITGNTLALSGSATTIDLAAFKDNTDAQTLTYDGPTKVLSISGGNNVTITETQTLAQVLAQGADAGANKITGLAAPTANTDATTKKYVDDADAALASMISTTYAFKTAFAYNNTSGGVTNDQTLTFTTEDFDDFNVLASNTFTASQTGTYVVTVDGSHVPVVQFSVLSVLVNGVKHPVSIFTSSSPVGYRYNSTFIFKLTAGQTISLVSDNNQPTSQFSGNFFGYKL